MVHMDDSGQAMIEAAIVLPVLVFLFLCILDFGLFSENQARVAMAARHGAWTGAHASKNGSGQFESIRKAVLKFFPPDAKQFSVQVDSEFRGVEFFTGGSMGKFINKIIGFLPSGLFGWNTRVDVTYSQNGLFYSAPAMDEGERKAGAFLNSHQTGYTVTAYWCDTDSWNDLGDVLKRLFGFEKPPKPKEKCSIPGMKWAKAQLKIKIAAMYVEIGALEADRVNIVEAEAKCLKKHWSAPWKCANVVKQLKKHNREIDKKISALKDRISKAEKDVAALDRMIKDAQETGHCKCEG